MVDRLKTILVAEDNEALRSSLMELLELEGYTAIGARDGRQAVLLARHHTPHLILCDIRMPILDGLEVIAILRQDPQTAAIPVVILSAYRDRDLREHELPLGVASYLTKPFSPDELLAVVQEHITR